ncbi:12975_t:CDS:2 [Cetraspora pellucida]|uniref:12975_t:CDS:1 n=1 Tax=Cetraspora pellucida TaxID=1433469 RepID=A0ACA9KJK4_9GLOM|nr:12975_t:CDS:2 [Cetraspora pellucida]
MGYAKKAFDLAIQADKVEEFVSHLKNFIEVMKNDLFSIQDNVSFISIKDPLHVPHKGDEPSKKAQHIVQSTDQSNKDKIQKVTKALNNYHVSTL